jgi:hemolysin D
LGLDDEIRRDQAARDEADAEVKKLVEALPLLQQRVDAFSALVEKGFGQRLQFLQEKQDLVEHQAELVAQRARLTEADEALTVSERRRQEAEAEYRRSALSELVDAQKQAVNYAGQLHEAEEGLRRQTLTAPIDGTVQQLAVHTIGGVVTPAEPLMVIVPADSALEIEAVISNRDIGFVHAGEPVKIKVGAFDFTRYGLLNGSVASVARDAVLRPRDTVGGADAGPNADLAGNEPEGAELVYTARIALDRTDLEIDGRPVSLDPGMAVTVEIRTGSRRVIDYLLSPLARYQQSALHER